MAKDQCMFNDEKLNDGEKIVSDSQEISCRKGKLYSKTSSSK